MNQPTTRCSALAICLCFSISVLGQEPRVIEYRQSIEPLLKTYCFECHSDGTSEGSFQFDKHANELALLDDTKLWHAVLKNVRSELMPPADCPRPSQEQRDQIARWIETLAFKVDPQDPNPGYIPPRRLNRAEYRHTIRDLMGIDFNAEVVFPPDDTGFGFDNLGDALGLSPLLMEKYIQSAKTIVDQAVPKTTWTMPSRNWNGGDFRSEDGKLNAGFLRNPSKSSLARTIEVEQEGIYRLTIVEKLHGSFDFDPRQYRVTVFLDNRQLYQRDCKWDEAREQRFQIEETWKPGKYSLRFDVEPIESSSDKTLGDPEGETFVAYQIASVQLQGPAAEEFRVHPENYAKFFPRSEPPESENERRQYAREILKSFTEKAYRRPSSESTVDRLVEIAHASYSSGTTFEEGISQAFIAVLASPRFLMKIDQVASSDTNTEFALIDEFSLASRLSYFLWSTMPDEELMRLAQAGQLRTQLDEQLKRMLDDRRSESFVKNFVGQWLRARDVEHTSIDPIFAMGHQKEFEAMRAKMAGRFRRSPRGQENLSPEEIENRNRFRELLGMRDAFDTATRDAMRQETEMAFEHIVRENRSLLELLDADYIFANEKLAKLYGIEGVQGPQMRKVSLGPDSLRGGVLTQGTMLTVTSNPTRTSPVKRGLFILDNILGTPAPPAPPNVPPLEDASSRFGDREPTLREMLQVHREVPLCASCHARMDTLGLALENFNAFGKYRVQENQQPIDAAGTLLTGESFQTVVELKKVLITSRRMDYYRCVTDKLLVYALGRGLEFYDEYTVDQIAHQLDQDHGKFQTLLHAIVHSAPFQKQRVAK